MKFLRKKSRAIKRLLKNRSFALLIAMVLLCISTIVYAVYIDKKRLTIDPATYAPLLGLIAQAESHGNYNAYFGNADNKSVNFTSMSIADVLKWQSDFIEQGSPSSAVGRYQFLNTTLSGLVQQLNLDAGQKFNESMQDKLAIALLERRGSEEYINEELPREQFAANLAKEWAGLPKVIGESPNDSYYASDGLNKARVTVDEVMKAIEPIRPK